MQDHHGLSAIYYGISRGIQRSCNGGQSKRFLTTDKKETRKL